MKKLLLLLTLFLPLIAMESEQPEKMPRLRTEEYGPHAFQPAEKRRKTVERPEDLIYPLPEIQETETFRSSLTKMSIAFLTQQSPQAIEQEHIASDPSVEEEGLIAEAENISSPAIINEKDMDILKRTDASTTSQNAKKIGSDYECPECKRLIKHGRKNLILHILTHTGEKPFPCTYPGCDKSFARKAHLITHMRTHTKPFKWHHCDSAFSYEAGLQKHIKKEHQMEN